MKGWIVCALAGACLTALPATLLRAQNTMTLEGTVVSTEGQPIAAARVAVANIGTGERRHTVTCTTGDVRVLGLFSGKYSVDVHALGYKPSRTPCSW